CTSPIRIDSNQIGRINTCTGTVGNDGADNLKLLLEMDGRLGTLIFYIAERTEGNCIAYRTSPISIEQLNTVLTVSFNVAIIEAVGIKPDGSTVQLDVVNAYKRIGIALRHTGKVKRKHHSIGTSSIENKRVLSSQVFGRN